MGVRLYQIISFLSREESCMKIFNDPKTPGLISDKNETQNRVSKKQGPEKNAPVLPAADELALTSSKVPPVPQMREI